MKSSDEVVLPALQLADFAVRLYLACGECCRTCQADPACEDYSTQQDL